MSITRGIRGAISVEEDNVDSIMQATTQLLGAILKANPSLVLEDIASAIFTLTQDLKSAYPATAARQMGWVDVPLLCAQEIDVPGGMPRVIRLLILWNTALPQSDIKHVYLGRAVALRPDLTYHLDT